MVPTTILKSNLGGFMFEVWTACKTREDFAGQPDNSTVFVRRARAARPLAAGPVFLLKFQGQNNFYTVAESYAGHDLYRLVVPLKNKLGKPLEADANRNAELDSTFVTWRSGLPSGSLRRRKT
jgi:hypothetical protein